MKSILIIQTAFIGDVILATPLIEKLHEKLPGCKIDFLVRKGNEDLLKGHPYLREILIWDKKKKKYAQLISLIKAIRTEKYDYVFNLQRFFTTGVITVFSGAKRTIGFDKNPMSLFFSKRYPHVIDPDRPGIHEVDRNLSLLNELHIGKERINPKLYPTEVSFTEKSTDGKYVTISPTSVWFTKQYPLASWTGVTNLISHEYKIYLLGGPADIPACEWIKANSTHMGIEIMAGKLNFLESAALMKNAEMNYVNDSAPLHMASATDAPVTAVFCSTVPAFGFSPLSTKSRIVETSEKLECRPCGLHGHKACPEGHFKCADISPERVLGRPENY